MTITTKEQAFEIIDRQEEFIPSSAIEFLYNHPSDDQIIQKISSALKTVYTDPYSESVVPLWYAIIAEAHLDFSLIEDIIGLAADEEEDWEYMNDQILYLTGAFCKKHGVLAVEKFLNGIEQIMDAETVSPYLFLFDCLYYIDKQKDYDQILRLLNHPNNVWLIPFATHLGISKQNSFLPAIKAILAKEKRKAASGDPFLIEELEIIIEAFETEDTDFSELDTPMCERREYWKSYYEELEETIYAEAEEVDNIIPLHNHNITNTVEVTTKEQAFEILRTQQYGIPFEAIEFLYNHEPDEEIVAKILEAMKLTYTDFYYDEDLDEDMNTPLWYMIVAENHLDSSYLDPLIQIIALDVDIRTEPIEDQVAFLIGALCEKYGQGTVEHILNAIEKMVIADSEEPYFFLFDCLYYADEQKHFEQIRRILTQPNNIHIEEWSMKLGDCQFTSFIPSLRKQIKKAKKSYKKSFALDLTMAALEDVIEELETGVSFDPENAMPYHKHRSPWYDYYKNNEDYFQEGFSDDSAADFLDLIDKLDEVMELGSELFGGGYNDDYYDGHNDDYYEIETVRNTQKVGRNEPCPCGSGKKYKKCCLKK